MRAASGAAMASARSLPSSPKQVEPRLEADGKKPEAEHSPAEIEPDPVQAAPQTKQALLIAMLKREEGATLLQLVEATGWLPHTTRAALTGLRKKGHVIAASKVDGVTLYRIQAAG